MFWLGWMLALAAPAPKMVDAGDAKLWTRAEGRGEVPLLFVHGGPGMTAAPFEQGVGPLLARDRRVIYSDYRGAGRSSRPEGAEHYSFAILGEDVERIRAAHKAEKVVVVGHSNGAATAMTYARAHPDRVAALVLLCPLISPADLEANAIQKVLLHPPEERKEAIAVLHREGGSVEERFLGVMDALPPRSRHAIQFATLEGQARFDASIEKLQQETGLESLMSPDLPKGMFAAGFFAFDAYGFADQLTMPVLVVGGAEDPELSLENSMRFALTVPNGDYVEIAQAGHHPFIEQPDALARAMDGFLDRHGL